MSLTLAVVLYASGIGLLWYALASIMTIIPEKYVGFYACIATIVFLVAIVMVPLCSALQITS